MTQIDQARLAKVRTLTLKVGAHREASGEMCIMEAAAFVAGEPWSDSPKCSSPSVAAAMRRYNDRLPTDEMRTALLDLLPGLIGSASTRAVEVRRGYVAADFACRIFAPMRLEACGHREEAARCRALGEITDRSSAISARDILRALRYKIYTAANADAAAAAADASYAAAAWQKIDPEFRRMIRAMLAVTE